MAGEPWWSVPHDTKELMGSCVCRWRLPGGGLHRVTELQACSCVGRLPNVIFWRPFPGAFQFPQRIILCSLMWSWLWGLRSRGVERSWGSHCFRMQVPLLVAPFHPILHCAWCTPAQSLLTSISTKNLQRWAWRGQGRGSPWLDAVGEGPRGSVNRLPIFSLFAVPHLTRPSAFIAPLNSEYLWGFLDGIIYFWSASLTLSVVPFLFIYSYFSGIWGKQQR